VHSAKNWRLVPEPVIAHYPERGVALYFRADAAFAKPEAYELLEAERHPLRPSGCQPIGSCKIGSATSSSDRSADHPRSRSCPTPASVTRKRAGPKRARWCPRSNGIRVSYTRASASS
jgi:hypothetical protein